MKQDNRMPCSHGRKEKLGAPCFVEHFNFLLPVGQAKGQPPETHGESGLRVPRATAPEIAQGASDLSEMGVYHDLYQPQRLANLNQRLSEFTPAGADAAVIYAN